MIQERKEDDEELIQFVSLQIHNPNGEKRNIFSKKLDYSEYKQSRIIDNLLLSKKNGFFVEAGAYDGEKMSNSLFFELSRNWTGLLIEPIPQHYQNLLSKNRNVFSINACLAKKHPIVAKFKEMDTLSARTVHMSRGLSSSIGNDYLYVPCYPLNTIMKAINKTVIDYFSLDLEGGEYEFIKNLDMSKKIKIELDDDLLKKLKHEDLMLVLGIQKLSESKKYETEKSLSEIGKQSFEETTKANKSNPIIDIIQKKSTNANKGENTEKESEHDDKEEKLNSKSTVQKKDKKNEKEIKKNETFSPIQPKKPQLNISFEIISINQDLSIEDSIIIQKK
ncbi:Star-like [Brachionus plicatilis]|uniref:Star-like n=1 Tax=Brachionus plicatilis TaxID=10195 RepID=A0A3M7Q3K8_BRAPC|nr:Star-like [Brachionus plicatilis]